MDNYLNRVGELNLLVCIVVFLASLTTLWRLTQCRDTVYGFVFRATVCWTLAWAVWVGLWAIIWRQGSPQGSWHSLSLGLSDANTVLQLLFCVGLTQGSRFKGKQYAVFAALILAFVVTADFFIYFFPSKSIDGEFVAGILHERWSLAIGMFASLVLGWGFKVRYGTLKVLIVGFVYAIMQPPAYEALFGKLKGTDGALVILALLAVLKVVFAWSVIYYLGIQPTDGKNLIHIGEEKPNAEKHDRWWPWLPKVFALVGLAVVGIEVWHLRSSGLKAPIDTIVMIISLIIGATVFLGAIDYLVSKFMGSEKKGSGSDHTI